MSANVKLEKKAFLKVVRTAETDPAVRAKELKKTQSSGKIVMPAQPVKYIKARKHDCL